MIALVTYCTCLTFLVVMLYQRSFRLEWEVRVLRYRMNRIDGVDAPQNDEDGSI